MMINGQLEEMHGRLELNKEELLRFKTLAEEYIRLKQREKEIGGPQHSGGGHPNETSTRLEYRNNPALHTQVMIMDT
jgi:hypothetical protein